MANPEADGIAFSMEPAVDRKRTTAPGSTCLFPFRTGLRISETEIGKTGAETGTQSEWFGSNLRPFARQRLG